MERDVGEIGCRSAVRMEFDVGVVWGVCRSLKIVEVICIKDDVKTKEMRARV